MHWRILAVTAFEFKMSLPTQQLQMPKKGWPYSTRLAFIISSQFERNLATCWEVKAFDLPIENFCTKLVKSWEVFFVGLLFIKNFDEPCQGEVGNAKETFNAANFYRSWKKIELAILKNNFRELKPDPVFQGCDETGSPWMEKIEAQQPATTTYGKPCKLPWVRRCQRCSLLGCWCRSASGRPAWLRSCRTARWCTAPSPCSWPQWRAPTSSQFHL